MSIITVDQYKTLAGVTGTNQDDRIEAIIPVVQSDVISICNYGFGTDTTPVAEVWPAGIQIYAVQMIGYLLATLGGTIGVKSETQGGYSYTLGDIGTSGYPAGIEKGLSKWTRVSVKNPQAMTQYRDRRLQTLKRLAEGGPGYGIPGIPMDEVRTFPYPTDPLGVE